MMKWLFCVSILISTAMASADTPSVIDFSNHLQAKIAWEKGPGVGLESLLLVELVDASRGGTPTLETGIPTFELWMPDMGHGSAPTVTQRVLDETGNLRAGVFRVSNIYFLMTGRWEARLRIPRAQGLETKTWHITIPD